MRKSAMQELKDNSLFTEGEEYIQIVLKKTEWIELLKKEKEQIMNDYSNGAKGGANGTKGQHEFGWVSVQTLEKYYKQTYKSN